MLAALQRMGRRPPPAVLVRPEDILGGGAHVDAARRRAARAARRRPRRWRPTSPSSSGCERRSPPTARALERNSPSCRASRSALDALVAARQSRLAEASSEASARERERGRRARPARRSTLKELIERMEREVAAGQSAAEEARQGRRRLRRARRASASPPRLSAIRRAWPRKSRFPRRAACCRCRSGARWCASSAVRTAVGGTSRGIVNRDTAPGCRSRRPADGWVAFAGPFRSFGRLLIINAGGGYYLLLAGMDQIKVEVGPVRARRGAGGDDGRHFVRCRRATGRVETERPRALCRVS